jgi:hypothetical protein
LDDVALEILTNMIEETLTTNTNRIITVRKEVLLVTAVIVMIENDIIRADGDEVEVAALTEKIEKNGIDITRAIGNGDMKNCPVIATEAMILKGGVVVIERKSGIHGMETTKIKRRGREGGMAITTKRLITKITGRDRIERAPVSTTIVTAKIIDERGRIVRIARTMTTAEIDERDRIEKAPKRSTRGSIAKIEERGRIVPTMRTTTVQIDGRDRMESVPTRSMTRVTAKIDERDPTLPIATIMTSAKIDGLDQIDEVPK